MYTALQITISLGGAPVNKNWQPQTRFWYNFISQFSFLFRQKIVRNLYTEIHVNSSTRETFDATVLNVKIKKNCKNFKTNKMTNWLNSVYSVPYIVCLLYTDAKIFS